ncbi:hypothetical protein BDR05DRAFT_1019486 [Suillus weaverae]|nr:hypothetical protein BDR05DRAFT_1019486 [Suillus weaverae]
MLLCKVTLNTARYVTSLLSIKLAVKYAQLREIESMHALALAHLESELGRIATPFFSTTCCISLSHTQW